MTDAPSSVRDIASRVRARKQPVEVPAWVPGDLIGLYEYTAAKSDEHDAAALIRALKKKQAVTL